jgi:broad specificity phosphatase PhoE
MSVAGARVITVLRHGECEGRNAVFRGRTDDPLSVKGWAQMRAAAVRFGTFDSISSSPLLRCREFAAEFAAARGLPLLIEPGFRERDFGAWECLSADEVAARFPTSGDPRQNPYNNAPGGGEAYVDFRARVESAWAEWTARTAPGAHLLVAHAGIMRALLVQLLGLPPENLYRLNLPNAGHFTVSLLAGQAPVLLSLNGCAD